MKIVNFDSITLKNFLSVGEEPVSVDFKPGLHIITGVNKDKQDRRNGVGKSTIADSIHFAIFGTTIRELKKENISNNLTSGTTHVELKFTIDNDNYKIIRTLKPSKCFFYINNKDYTRDSIANTTEYICKLLNTTQEIFQNCVIMTLNNTVPFMAKKKIEKRKFIEGIFGLEVFSQMLSEARSNYNDVKKEFDSLTTRFEEVNRNLASWESQQDSYTAKVQGRINKLNDRKKSNNDKIDKIKESSVQCNDKQLAQLNDNVKGVEKSIEKCDNHLETIGVDKIKHEQAVLVLKDKLKRLGTSKDKCPVCMKPVTEHDRNDIKQEKDKINTKVDEILLTIKTITNDVTTYNGLKSTLKQKLEVATKSYNDCIVNRKEAEKSQEQIDQFNIWNKEADDELKEIANEKDPFTDNINENKERLKTLQDEIDGYKHKLEILDVIKFIVSEEGVKSYIVRKILQLFNSKLQYYLRRMDSNCCCIFNEYFEDEIINEKNKTCSYHNFSGAEKKNIDLACLFAFMDIRRLQGSVAYNFSVYDELLDSSLDERGVDLVLSLLHERVEKYNECIIIISHRKESVKIGSHYKNPGEVIYLEKEKGITRRVDYVE